MATQTASTADAAPKKRKWGNVSTVTLVVGETKTSFHAHEANLFKVSPVFKAAFSSTFKEGSDRTMTLPDDDDELFDLLVEWLYTQNYNMPQPTGDKDKDAGRFREPIRLYVLADKYGITSLKNMIAKMVFHAMQEYNTVWPDMNTIAYTYQNVPSTSGMRKLLADFHACKPNPDWYNITKVRILLQSNPEFAADVMLSLFRSTSGASMRMKAYLEDE